MTVLWVKSATAHTRDRYAQFKKSQSHKQHIWFLPTHKLTHKNQKSCFQPTHRQNRKMQSEEEILKSKKVKNTAVRTVVLRHLLSQEKAQSLKDIENALAYTDRSSIFRTLKTFEENKVIHSIEDGSGMTKYAVCVEGCNCDPKDLHYHFYCTNCDKTFCLLDLPIPDIQLPKNFKLQQANMVVKGLCDYCNT